MTYILLAAAAKSHCLRYEGLLDKLRHVFQILTLHLTICIFTMSCLFWGMWGKVVGKVAHYFLILGIAQISLIVRNMHYVNLIL